MQSIQKTRLYDIIKKDLKAYNGKISLFKGEYCGGNERCHGIFELNSKEEPIIKVAIGNKSKEQGLGVLIHEYCHFIQWRDKVQVWRDFEESDFSIQDVIDSPKKCKREILSLIKLEADCEKRVIKLIKKHKLFCPLQYAREANAILFKYGFIYTNGFWPRTGAGLTVCWKACPDKIRRSYLSYLDIPQEVYNIFSNSQP